MSHREFFFYSDPAGNALFGDAQSQHTRPGNQGKPVRRDDPRRQSNLFGFRTAIRVILRGVADDNYSFRRASDDHPRLFWRVILGRGPRQLEYLPAALFVFSAALVTGLPGALIASAPRVMYLQQPFPTLPWGMTPLADQQLAGLIMWIPMDLILFGVSLTLLGLSMSARMPNRSHSRRVADTVRLFAFTPQYDRRRDLLFGSEQIERDPRASLIKLSGSAPTIIPSERSHSRSARAGERTDHVDQTGSQRHR